MLVVFSVAGIAAIISQHILSPTFKRKLKVR